MSGPLETATIDTKAAFPWLVLEWDRLWRKAERATPFQSPGWLVSWWDVFAPGALSIVTVRKHGALVGLAPLYLEEGGRLLPLGVPVTDYSDILLDPASADEAARALSGHLTRAKHWNSLHWPDLPHNASALSLPFPSTYVQIVERCEVCPYLPLPATVESIGTILPGRKRRDLRTAAHRARRHGAVTSHSLADRSVEEMLGDLFLLHGLRWCAHGERGVLADERVQQFHLRAAARLAEAGVLRCYGLRIGEETAALYYGFLRGRHAYGYLAGFNPAFSYESPGTLIIAHAIREAVQEGAREFHFLRGGQRYKYRWGARDRWNSRRIIQQCAEFRRK